MPRTCFSPTQVLYDKLFRPPEEHKPEIKLGLDKKQVRWQRCRWGYFTDLWLFQNGYSITSEAEIIEKWNHIYQKTKVSQIPKACVYINTQTLEVSYGFNPCAQLHHIRPKMYTYIVGSEFDPDDYHNNIIPLDPYFHNGFNYKGDLPKQLTQINPLEIQRFPIVHPDCAITNRRAEDIGWSYALYEQKIFFDKCVNMDIAPYNPTWDDLFFALTEDSYWVFQNTFDIPYTNSTRRYQNSLQPTTLN